MTNEPEPRIDVILLGRKLGTASGWDGDPGELIRFYDFTPAAVIGLRATETLHIDYVSGYISSEPEPAKRLDILTFLRDIPRHPAYR
jgi:hypothetical protein